jgi:hypothetical protein
VLCIQVGGEDAESVYTLEPTGLGFQPLAQLMYFNVKVEPGDVKPPL